MRIISTTVVASLLLLAPLAFGPEAVEPIAGASNVEECSDQNDRHGEQDLPERDEIRRTVELRPGAQVEVSSINGSVTVETSPGSVAEIHIVRSAKTRAHLDSRKIFIEESLDRLTIKGENSRGKGSDVRQRVMLKLPRSVSLAVRGINGRVGVGAIDGMIHVSGINGRVEVAHAMSATDISGINGKVSIALTRLDDKGLDISGVNGRVTLQFSEQLNADISVSGINGHVSSEIGNITVVGKMTPHSFKGRIGAGGPPITVSGVNGHIRLLPVGAAIE